MKYVEAPEIYYTLKQSIFLAGGITNCPNWQKKMVQLLKNTDTDLVIYNPRRENFPIDDPTAAYKQIEWEFKMLDSVDMILFWFSRGSLNPIVLFEYGKWLMNTRYEYKPIFVGIDPEYKRIKDVEIQTRLEDELIRDRIVYSLEELANQVIEKIKR